MKSFVVLFALGLMGILAISWRNNGIEMFLPSWYRDYPSDLFCVITCIIAFYFSFGKGFDVILRTGFTLWTVWAAPLYMYIFYSVVGDASALSEVQFLGRYVASAMLAIPAAYALASLKMQRTIRSDS